MLFTFKFIKTDKQYEIMKWVIFGNALGIQLEGVKRNCEGEALLID